MFQKSVDEVPALSIVKQISDYVVTNGEAPLQFDGFFELISSALSTYDKKHEKPRPAQRDVHSTNLMQDYSYYAQAGIVNFGIFTNAGDDLTFKLLTPSNKVITRPGFRSALDPLLRHNRLAPFEGEYTIHHANDDILDQSRTTPPASDNTIVPAHIATIESKDLIGRTFLKETMSYGQRFRAN
jgi:hypothetical protein